MHLNSDFSQRVVIRPEEYGFVPSPLSGVSRMMFDRVGDEVARATSIVRYEPGAGYSGHVHEGGEEIFLRLIDPRAAGSTQLDGTTVLDKMHSDEFGIDPMHCYPASGRRVDEGDQGVGQGRRADPASEREGFSA